MRTVEDLVPEIVAATIAGKLEWKEIASFSSSPWYWVPLGRRSIVTYAWQTDDGERTGYAVSLVSGGSEPNFPMDVIDSISDDEYGPTFSLVRELYQAARRSALQVDSVVGEVEDFLKGL